MGAKYTQAQKEATEKYQKTLANISIRIKREDYAPQKDAASVSGQSLRDYVLTALDEKIERDSGGGSSL